MTIRFSRRGLHGYVVNVLGERIIKGKLKPGHTIDLDQLLDELEVSRTVLREAIKVLTEKGLLEARPRYGTYVTARSEWHLIDEDVMSWRSAGDPDLLLVHELGEVRQIFEPSAARLAALRRTGEQLTDMERALKGMRENADTDQTSLVIDFDVDFHRAILAATGNELLVKFEVMLEPALHARNTLTLEESENNHFLEQHALVYQAICDKDPDAAQAAMAALMAAAMADTAEIISGIQP